MFQEIEKIWKISIENVFSEDRNSSSWKTQSLNNFFHLCFLSDSVKLFLQVMWPILSWSNSFFNKFTTKNNKLIYKIFNRMKTFVISQKF